MVIININSKNCGYYDFLCMQCGHHNTLNYVLDVSYNYALFILNLYRVESR